MVGREQDGGDVVSIPDVAERLMAEFGARVDLATITDVVLGCRRDLPERPEPPCQSTSNASPASTSWTSV